MESDAPLPWGRVAAIWGTQGVARAASSALTIGISLHLFATTGSASLMATVVAVNAAAAIYLSPLVGGLVDALSKRSAVRVASLASALLSATFVWSVGSQIHTVPLLVAVALLGAFEATLALALQAAIPLIVGPDHYVRINAFSGLIQNTPLVVGPVVGAALYAAGGISILTIVASLAFVLAALGASAVPQDAGSAAGRKARLRLPFRGAVQGLRLLFAEKPMRNAQLAYALTNIGNGLSAGIMSALTLSVVGGDEKVLAFASAAAVVGLVLAASLIALRGLPGACWRWVLLGLLVAALFGRGPLLLAQSGLVIIACYFIRAFALELSNAPLLAIWQQATDKELRGSVFGARRLLAQGGYPVAVWCGGVLVDGGVPPVGAIGAFGFVVALGVLIELAGIVWMASSKALAQLEAR